MTQKAFWPVRVNYLFQWVSNTGREHIKMPRNILYYKFGDANLAVLASRGFIAKSNIENKEDRRKALTQFSIGVIWEVHIGRMSPSLRVVWFGYISHCREMENISRGPTIGYFVSIRSMQDVSVARLQSTRVQTPLSPCFNCNVLRESLSVDSQHIRCATLKRRGSWVTSVCISLFSPIQRAEEGTSFRFPY